MNEYLIISKELVKKYGVEKGIFLSVLAEIKRWNVDSKTTLSFLKTKAFPFWGEKHISDLIHNLESDNILSYSSGSGNICIKDAYILSLYSISNDQEGKRSSAKVVKKLPVAQTRFNEIWDAYPEDKRGSYPAAYKMFLRLSAEEQEKAVNNVGLYLQQTSAKFTSNLLNYIYKGKYGEVQPSIIQTDTKDIKEFLIKRKEFLNK